MQASQSPRLLLVLVGISISLLARQTVSAGNWPMWRYDAGRTAASPEQLPAELHFKWSRKLPHPKPAWPEDPRLLFDATYEPIVVGQMLYVASMVDDSVAAYDTRTGEERWRFFADAPVRLAPVAKDGKLYFGADDGRLYCVDAASGKLLWRLNAALGPRRAIGNERLISLWPVRGGPVIQNEKLYFTSGIWPFEGAFLNVVDLAAPAKLSGKTAPPPATTHTAPDLSPQGHLVAANDKIYIPTGRGPAACFDTKAGRFVQIGFDSRALSDYHVVASGNRLFHGHRIFEVDTRKLLSVGARRPVVAGDVVYATQGDKILPTDLTKWKMIDAKDRRGRPIKKRVYTALWHVNRQQIVAALDANAKKPANKEMPVVHIKAGPRVYGSLGNLLFAIDKPDEGGKAVVSWATSIEGTPATMLAADGRLFVATSDGTIHCFGGEKSDPKAYALAANKDSSPQTKAAAKAKQILNHSGQSDGYCLVWGAGKGDLIAELARQSKLQIIVFDNDPTKVDSLRLRFHKLGLYGTRVAAMVGDPVSSNVPPYLANLVVMQDFGNVASVPGKTFVAGLYRTLRPYGGTVCLELLPGEHDNIARLVKEGKLPGAKLSRDGTLTCLKRDGPLRGAADWTHEYGSPANTLMSRDKLVRAPLGVLWFGGPAANPKLFFDRHFWGPSTTIVEGRMFLQGHETLAAVDIYTGRMLWQVPIERGSSPGRRGNFYDGNHHTGYHFVAVADAVYLTYQKTCLRIEPQTGKTAATFKLPGDKDSWGRIRVWKDLLIVPVFNADEHGGKAPSRLVALNRTSGEVVWEHKPDNSCPVVAVGGGKVFLFDGLLQGFYNDIKRKGVVPKSSESKVVKALDARTGKLLWGTTSEQTTTWLAYSEEHDALVASNRRGIEVVRGASGDPLWKKSSVGKGFRGHPESRWDRLVVWKDRIIDQRGPGVSYELLTGEPIMRKHPITGKPVKWEFTMHGHHCAYAIANEHMLTFRAGHAGFADLVSGESGRLTGFRSGCRNSLIPAGGVLSAPNFAYGCSCSYSIYTSLALVHVPEVEMWSYSALGPAKDQFSRVGINLGAPGDRLAPDGTLWLDYPTNPEAHYMYAANGGTSPSLPVEIAGDSLRWFRVHSSQIKGEGLRWVAASGVEGIKSLSLKLPGKSDAPRQFKVRLFFTEPDHLKAKARVFDVLVDGKPVLLDFDIHQAAGGARIVVVKEISTKAGGELRVELKAKSGKPILCGLEVVAVGE